MLTKNVNFLMKNVILLLPNHYKCCKRIYKFFHDFQYEFNDKFVYLLIFY